MDLVNKMLAGRYEIREEIGKGGMAQVYKAWCNILNRYVAIKVLKEEFKDDREFVHRFNVEAQAAARISNLHVVSIYDVGYENGLYYIVMEYIEGITLKEYIEKKGHLHWTEAASFAAQICEGLDAAHKNHVIHRDIKPQNIILTPEGVLKVTDFGIARATTQATTTTGTSAIGSVHYLSPEQARGGFTDERTDIYSLGIVLYEMLTGRLPFLDDTPVAIAIKHIQESPTPLRELKPDIPVAMEAVTLRAMHKEKDVRYASAGAFLKDLNKVLLDPYCVIDGVGGEAGGTDGMDSTIKMPRVDDQDIEAYEAKRKRQEHSKRNGTEKKQKGENNLREDNARRDEKKKERRVTFYAILTAILVIVGLSMVFSGLTGGFSAFQGGDTLEIPDLVDMDLIKAQHQYKDIFSIVRTDEIASDRPAGVILEQSIAAGRKVPNRDDIIIRVVVSAGRDASTMEGYVGMNKDDAKRFLLEKGFQVNIIEDFSDSVEKDMVIAQDPVAGSSVSGGGLVTLYVSKGSKDGEPKPSASASATESAKPTETPKPTETQNPTPSATASVTTPTATATTNSGTTTPSDTTTGGTTGGGATQPEAPSNGTAPGVGD